MDTTEFVETEASASKAIGLTQEVLAAHRKSILQRGTDWCLRQGKVFYSASGLERLREAIGLTKEPPPPAKAGVSPDAKAPPPPPDPPGNGPCTVLVVDRIFRNRHLVSAVHPDQRRLLVKVKDSRFLRVGMKMPCRPTEGPMWELDRRLPRAPGKW